MKVTVCELRNQPAALEDDWRSLAAHVRAEGSDLVLLPEMPFHPWLASTRQVDPAEWLASVQAHQAWIARLPELGTPAVVATRPVIDGDQRFNQALVWQAGTGETPACHRKQYLPEEEGFWEASWYSPGPAGSACATVAGASIGFAICTEMWFLHRAREYSKQGIQLLACPRATLRPSTDKWLAGGRTAAVVSGAFCLSSNFSGAAGSPGAEALGRWGGTGWIVDPEEGDVLATTSAAAPFATVDLDLAVADAAKTTYPRYVPDL